MKRRSRPRAFIGLTIGLLVTLLLLGVVTVARKRTISRATTTFHTPLTGEVKWHGDWQVSEQGADPSQAGSMAGTDYVTIPFTGTDFALRVRRKGYRAYFWVSVDGEPANQLPQTKKGAYLVLSSPDYEPQVVTIPVASGLTEGPHVVEIVADRGWDQWPLVGWRVGRGLATTLYDRALTGLKGLATACLVGAIWSGTRWLGSKVERERRKAGGKEERCSTAICDLESAVRGWSRPFSFLCFPLSILVAAGVFYVSPWFSFTVVSGLVLALLILLRLDLGLALVALTVPFYLHPRSLLGKTFSMAEIVTLLCAASWGVRWIIRWQRARSTRQDAGDKAQEGFSLSRPALFLSSSISTADLATLSFVLVSVASVLFAEYGHVALRELRVVILEPALFYLMLRTSRLDEKAVRRIVDAFVFGAAAVALIGLTQYVFDVNTITAEQGFRRLRSIYGSPNNAALYLGRALPMAVAVVLFGRGCRRALYGLAVLSIAPAILLSFSRGAILLGVPLSLLALGVLAGGRWLWVSGGVVILVALALVPLLRTPRFAALLDPHSGTLFFRLQLWRASWMMFHDHPWLGVGPDNFLYQYRGRYILPAAWQEPHLSHAHNVLLDYATRLGILGLAAGVWLQVAFWRLALPLRDLDDPDRRALALGLMGSMVSFLAHGLVDASCFFPDLAFAFFLVLGLVQWLRRTTSFQV